MEETSGMRQKDPTGGNDRSRAWVFTWNNYPEDAMEKLKAYECRYGCFGLEVGNSGTPHIQGFFYFVSAKKFKTLKKDFPQIHWERMRGTVQEAVNYCQKDGLYEEVGDRPVNRGEKEQERWTEALTHAKAGELDLVPADILIRCYSSIKAIAKDNMKLPPDNEDVCGVWFYGKAGTGKSRAAREEYPNFYLKNPNKWWDGFTDKYDYAIIDDFDKRHEHLAPFLKIWADRYAFLGENKFGGVAIRPKKIIVTSNYHPREIWERESDLAPILRRFKITCFKRLDEVFEVNNDNEEIRISEF